jgi:hypothetical protein
VRGDVFSSSHAEWRGIGKMETGGSRETAEGLCGNPGYDFIRPRGNSPSPSFQTLPGSIRSGFVLTKR